MTGGIIQEVIKSVIDVTRARNNRLLNLTFPEVSDLLEQIQQELIEKIKQESDVYQSEISDYKDAISLEKLIGDIE